MKTLPAEIKERFEPVGGADIVHPDTLGYPLIETWNILDGLEAQRQSIEGELATADVGPNQAVFERFARDGSAPYSLAWRIDARRALVGAELQKIREQLHGTKGGTRKRANEAVIGSLTPALKEAFEDHPRTRLANPTRVPDVLGWLTLATHRSMLTDTPEQRAAKGERKKSEDGRLEEFLRAHVQAIAGRQQDPVFRSDVQAEKDMWLDGVERGMEKGYYDQSALLRARHIGFLVVYEGDDFSTLVRESLGYHRFGQHSVVVARGHTRSAGHEFNHALLSALSPLATQRDSLGQLWINEVLTVHADNVNRGDTTVDKVRDDTDYVQFSKLFNELYARAVAKGASISPWGYLKAYSSIGQERRRHVDHINSELNCALGLSRDTLRAVQVELDCLVAQYKKGKVAVDEDYTKGSIYAEAAAELTERLRRTGKIEPNATFSEQFSLPLA